MKYSVHFLDSEQECAVMVSMALLLSGAHLPEIWPEQATDRIDYEEVEVVVVPLNRIGAPSGASGADVFITYFRRDRRDGELTPPSKALVMKLQKGGSKLVHEKNAADAWPNIERDRIAKPFALFSVRGHTVLVAPFRAHVDPVVDEQRLKFQKLTDLWKKLDVGAPDVKAGLAAALGLVSRAHQASWTGGRPKELTLRYSDKYAWYLRETEQGKPRHTQLLSLFGAGDVVTAFGQKWPNPSAVIQKLLAQADEFSGRIGSVHGDLHPKNVIFDKENNAHIIDFGWARNDMHVVADYVLMDINMRAMTLPPHVPESELVSAGDYLYPSDPFPAVGPLLRDRLTLVRDVIWSGAFNSGATSADAGLEWTRQYVVPYFLVSYGLLVFLESARNERALVASVLSCARRLTDELTLA